MTMTETPAPEPLSVLVIDDDGERAAVVENGLISSGCRVLARVRTGSHLTALVRELNPDVIIIDAEAADRDTLEHMRTIGTEVPRPIVMFFDRIDAEMTRQAIQAGVSAYVAASVGSDTIRPVVEIAIARFKEVQSLRQELERTKEMLAARKQVERAKGILMEKRGWKEEKAYHTMRKMAMEEGVKLADIAQAIIVAHRLDKE